jgi:protein tyrosine phosphatase (PTP) superfamily phosphohydrolase (DUF442 family)
MIHRRCWLVVATVGTVAGAAGCRTCCRTAAPPAEAYVAYPSRPVIGYTPSHPLTPVAAGPVVSPAPPAPTPQTAGTAGAAVPAAEPAWQPPPNGAARPAVAEAAPAPPSPPDARLLTPEPARPAPPAQPAVAEDRAPAPAAGEQRRMPSLPVGIPQFSAVKDQVSAGLRPLLDGLDWLQSNGYRTVLHVRGPGTDDTADRREVEKRGMKYLSVETSPQNLAQAVDAFSREAGDRANYPLFVYDKDGTLAGGLWFVYLRTAERLPDESARAQARRLGLKEAATEEQRAMWLAIQKYLSSVPSAANE